MPAHPESGFVRRSGNRDGGGQRLGRAQKTYGKQSPQGAEALGEAPSAHTLLALVQSIWMELVQQDVRRVGA